MPLSHVGPGGKQMQLIRLFQPGMIGRLEIKNRLVMPAMGNSLASAEGHVTREMIDYYVERAKGGVGFIITQWMSITPEASLPGSPGIYHDGFIPGLGELVTAVHQHGAKIAVQLCHLGMIMVQVGRPGDREIVVPSMLPWMKERGGFRQLSARDIDRYVDDFAEATRRAKEAGFDAVEFHACHGCLLSSFLSQALNRRGDEYGGSTENRARFACQILAKSRQKVGPDFPLIFRINGDDDYEGGTRAEEAARQAMLLEQAAVDAVSVSAGLEFWSPLALPCYLYPAGLLIPLAAVVKKAIRAPVIAAGKIDPVLGERILEEGKADFIALGRPLLADPYLPNKAREGRLDDIRQCIYCNNCLFSSEKMRYRFCTVNPFLFRESQYPPKPAESKKRAMVIGGGLAGMQAAAILGERGHDVSLYERENELGGQWKVASALKAKQSYATFTKQLSQSLLRAGVKVFTGTEVTRELVLQLRPDAVVLATGAIPQTLNVLGAEASNVVQANDVIMGRVKVGRRVVVLGGRFLGMEVAILLAEQGKKVTLVSRSRISGKKRPIERQTYKALFRRLIELSIPLYPNCSVIEITKKGVYVEHNEGIFLLEADTVVLAVGAQSQNKLAAELKGVVSELYQIGDCVEPEDARTATYEAASVALQV